MSEVLEQLARYRFDSALSEIHGTDNDTLYRIFKTPEAIAEYLREFDLNVEYRPNQPFSPTARQLSEGDDAYGFRFLLLVLAIAPHAEAFSVPEMRAWAAVAPTNGPALPSIAMFRRFRKAGITGTYAGTLWRRGADGKAILAAHSAGIPLEYAAEALRR